MDAKWTSPTTAELRSPRRFEPSLRHQRSERWTFRGRRRPKRLPLLTMKAAAEQDL
jgi:hypothetical protein